MVATGLFSTGCGVGDNITPTNNNATVTTPGTSRSSEPTITYKYFKDGHEVSSLDLGGRDSAMPGVTTISDVVDSLNYTISIFAFTKEADLLTFSDNKGWPVRGQFETAAHLSHYADSTGATAEFDSTGIMPEDYLNYAEEYTGGNKTAITGIHLWHEYFFTTGNKFIINTPSLTRRNEIIHINFFTDALVYTITLYDITFFFRLLTHL